MKAVANRSIRVQYRQSENEKSSLNVASGDVT